MRKSRRKRTLRRTLLMAAGLFMAGIMGGTAWIGRHYLTHSPRFTLRRIDIGPTVHADAGALRAIAARHAGRNLFRLDLGRVAAEMQDVPWVRSVSVKRILPDRLHCAIEERVPRGLARLEGEVWLVDGEGHPIDRYGRETLMYSFPIFTGLDDRDADQRRRQIRRGVALLTYLDLAAHDLTAQISEIDLRREDRITLQMSGGGPEVRLNANDFGANLDRYLTMRDYLATHFGDGAYVDLRFRDSISFQPAIPGRQ